MLLSWGLKRNEQAWRELVRRFRPLMFRCILLVLRRHDRFSTGEEADEVFGETCLGLMRDDMHKLRSFDPARSRLGSFLGLLCSHAACDHLRKKARRPRIQDVFDDPLTFIAAPEPGAEELLLEKERWARLSQVLSGISTRDRHFVELYYGQGLSAEDVAEIMGISAKTVYSKKNKLLARLCAKGPRRDRADEVTAVLA